MIFLWLSSLVKLFWNQLIELDVFAHSMLALIAVVPWRIILRKYFCFIYTVCVEICNGQVFQKLLQIEKCSHFEALNLIYLQGGTEMQTNIESVYTVGRTQFQQLLFEDWRSYIIPTSGMLLSTQAVQLVLLQHTLCVYPIVFCFSFYVGL